MKQSKNFSKAQRSEKHFLSWPNNGAQGYQRNTYEQLREEFREGLNLSVIGISVPKKS